MEEIDSKYNKNRIRIFWGLLVFIFIAGILLFGYNYNIRSELILEDETNNEYVFYDLSNSSYSIKEIPRVPVYSKECVEKPENYIGSVPQGYFLEGLFGTYVEGETSKIQ